MPFPFPANCPKHRRHKKPNRDTNYSKHKCLNGLGFVFCLVFVYCALCFRRQDYKSNMSRTSNLLLRIALSFAFLYPAYGLWQKPLDWVGYIPAFVKNAGLSQDTLVMAFIAVHLVIALWILSGWRVLIPSLLAAVFLGSNVYFNWNQLDVLFRDISLALVALALAFSSKHQY